MSCVLLPLLEAPRASRRPARFYYASLACFCAPSSPESCAAGATGRRRWDDAGAEHNSRCDSPSVVRRRATELARPKARARPRVLPARWRRLCWGVRPVRRPAGRVPGFARTPPLLFPARAPLLLVACLCAFFASCPFLPSPRGSVEAAQKLTQTLLMRRPRAGPCLYGKPPRVVYVFSRTRSTNRTLSLLPPRLFPFTTLTRTDPPSALYICILRPVTEVRCV